MESGEDTWCIPDGHQHNRHCEICSVSRVACLDGGVIPSRTSANLSTLRAMDAKAPIGDIWDVCEVVPVQQVCRIPRVL